MQRVTRGSRLLAAYVQEGHPQAEIAESVSKILGREVHQGTVSNWATGKHVPQGAQMAALHEVVGIPILAWTEIVDDDADPPAATGTDDPTHRG